MIEWEEFVEQIANRKTAVKTLGQREKTQPTNAFHEMTARDVRDERVREYKKITRTPTFKADN